MPILVHLTAEANVKKILRNGIKAIAYSAVERKGVYCMPVLKDFYASHQWLRELKRGSGREKSEVVAIDFRLPSSDIVLVGHYSQPHVETTIAEAAKVIMTAEDPMGYELFLPRSVHRDEIHKVRAVPQVIGWRYHPKAKGTKPCPCEYCSKGEYGASKLRK